MFYTYILKSQINNSFYVGSCGDIDNRFVLHNKGIVRSTKRYIPWIVVCKEEYKTFSEARKREVQIKSWKQRKMIENLIIADSR